MDPEPVDLRPLDPMADAAHREALVAAILTRAQPELVRRAGSPIVLLSRWVRPTLATAALLAVTSAALLLLARERAATQSAAGPRGIAEALDVPAPLNAWVVGDRNPTVSDLVLALEGEAP